jgi:rubrerythrin
VRNVFFLMATTANSVAAAEGEKLEWGTLYPNFADVAEEEGFSEVPDKCPVCSHPRSYFEVWYENY